MAKRKAKKTGKKKRKSSGKRSGRYSGGMGLMVYDPRPAPGKKKAM
jgi:hypothetical protein